METHKRTIVKALTWRVFGFFSTAAILWVATGRLTLAAAVGILDAVVRFALYYVHERVWNRFDFGRMKSEKGDYEI